MARITRVLTRRCRRGQAGEAVRQVCRVSQEAGRAAKELILQKVLDDAVSEALGPPRGVRPTAVAPWRCPTCGERRGDQLRRNGHYRRQLLVNEGVIQLRMPQLICSDCARSVAVEHPLLPRRQRLWLDIHQRVVSLYLEGCSYRATKRLLERDARTTIGLMSTWRRFQAAGEGPHAIPERPPAHYLGLDEVYQKVKGQKRFFLSVRAQDEHGGKHWVGSLLSSDRSQDAWESALAELGISRYHPPFAVLSDGDQAIEGAVATALPGARLRRCTWHLKHNAAAWIREHHPGDEDEGQRRGLMAAVHVIVDASTLDRRQASLDAIRPDFPWLVERLEPVLQRVPPKDDEHPVRTNNLLERGFRELRRRTRPMDGFGSDKGASNFHLIWMIKENARVNGRDYLVELIP